MYAFGRFVGIRRVGQRVVHFDGAYMPFAALRSFAFLLDADRFTKVLRRVLADRLTQAGPA